MAAKENSEKLETSTEQLEESVQTKPKRVSRKPDKDDSVSENTEIKSESPAPKKRKAKSDSEASETTETPKRRKPKSDTESNSAAKTAESETESKPAAKRTRKAAKSQDADAVTEPSAVEPPAAPNDLQHNAQSSEPQTDAVAVQFFEPMIKLKRKKGTLVKTPKSDLQELAKPQTEKPAFYAVQPIEATPSEAPFQPKHLEETPNFPIRTLGQLELTTLSWTVSRPKGRKQSRIEREARMLQYSGMVRIPMKDRASIFKDLEVYPENEDIAPLRPIRFVDFLREYVNSPLRARFNATLRNTMRWNVVSNWYAQNWRQIEVPEPEPDAQEPQNPQETPVLEEPGPDPAVEALFDIFERPLERLHLDSDDLEELRLFYSANHAGRITSLFVDWARSLEYIDRGVFGGPKNQPLSVCFIERFQQILISDFEAAESQGVLLPDFILRRRFYLDDIDLLLLWLMAGHEMDPVFRTAMKVTWDQQTVIYMSTATLMRFFCITAFDRTDVMARLAPSSTMASAGLFKIVQGNVPTQPLAFELVVSEQIVRQFMGIRSLSVASTQYAELQFPHFSEETFIADNHTKTLDIIKNYYERPSLNIQPNLERENLDFIPSMAFLVEGLPGSGRTTLIKLIASKFRRPIIIVQSSPLAGIHPTDCEDYLKTVFTDAALMNAIICFRDSGPLLTEEKTAAVFARQLALRPVVCAFCVELAVKTHPSIDPYITFKTKMDANLKDNATAFWNQHLRLPQMNSAQIDVLALSQRMALQPFQIQKATKLAYYSTNLEEQNIPVTNTALEKAAAVQVTKNIGNLAFVSDPEIDLTDVIVSDDIMDKIKRIIGSAQNRRRVLYEWGLSKRIRRGTGVIALFDGEPGTGKTHSAEAIAHELGLSLMRINIATMVDKYIGETEKNLTTIFEQARPDMQLLLFDEADSLFTKRTSNVSKSNDRYSNMSVNVLLQLVERYEGVSILTTNLKNAIDPAFERRITYKVYFPMPKKPERERLWRYMCPPDILTAEPIDYEWLSELEMSGGEIKNSVLTAAFTAATMGVLLNSEILYNAGVAEASAAGRVLRRYEEGDDFNEY